MIFNSLHFAIVLFLAVAVIFAVSPLMISLLIAPKNTGGDYGMPYECGMRPMGRSWGLFGLNYYIYGLIFIAFDVDVLYLFPVALYYSKSSGLLALAELTYFLFFVLLAILYCRAKGVFEWPRQIQV